MRSHLGANLLTSHKATDSTSSQKNGAAMDPTRMAHSLLYSTPAF